MIEAAIVMPLLITLVMGIIDFGMVFSDMQTVGSASRQGARSGVAYSRQSGYDQQVTAAVAAALQARTTGTPLELWIYAADTSVGDEDAPIGFPNFEDCVTKCIKYTWSGSAGQPAGGSGWAWNTMRTGCLGSDDFDVMGVRVKVRHDLVTGLFGDDITLTDKTVMRLEPQPLATCG
jgi:hypothetical protein